MTDAELLERIARMLWDAVDEEVGRQGRSRLSWADAEPDRGRAQAIAAARIVLPLVKAGMELRITADPEQNMSAIPLIEAMTRWDAALRPFVDPPPDATAPAERGTDRAEHGTSNEKETDRDSTQPKAHRGKC